MSSRRAFLSAVVASAALPALAVAFRSGRTVSERTIVTLSGAGPEGRWYQETALFGKILTQHMSDVIVNGVTGKGVSVGNIKRIAAGRVEGGRFYLFDLENAHANLEEFREGDYDDVLVWMKLGTNLFRVVGEAGIDQFSDLRGKTVAIGVRGSGDDRLAHRILGGYGVDESNTRFIYVGRSDGHAALANRQIDAVAFSYTRNNRGHLGPVFAARRLGEEVDFVLPDNDSNETFLAANSTFFLDTLGEPVFGRPELPGIAYYQGMAISRHVPEDLVYGMTKTIYENWNTLLTGAPWLGEPGEASLESGPAITKVPYHDGARRYFRERGVWENFHES